MTESTREPDLYDELETMYNNQQSQAINENYGDIMNETPDNNTTRIYCQNINGLSWDKVGGQWPYICETMEGIRADIACFAETNTNTNKYNIHTSMETIAQRQFQHSRLIMSSSKYDTPSSYKPGGTAILACNAITSMIKSHTRDRMGRWVTISLSTKSTRCIRIISAYQVCNNTRQGTNTAASQQQAQIIEEQATSNNTRRKTPRQAFIEDLQSFIHQVQATGEDIILVGDFNDDITEETSGMAQLASECGLADLFSIRLGSPNTPATYQRGHRRLDYALITPSLTHHVRSAGYDPFGYRIPSDHRAFYIDFQTDALFQQSTQPLAPADRRDFFATNPEVVSKYVSTKMQYLDDHRFFERLKHLNESQTPNHELAESLDRDFQRASHHAANECSRRKQSPWSPRLALCWATLHFYRLAKSASTCPINVTPSILKLQQKWPELPQNIPTNIDEIKEKHNNAIQELKTIRREAQEARDEYLKRKVAMYEALNEKGKAKIVTRLIRAETQHRVYKKINYLRNQDAQGSGLSSLKIPRATPVTETETIKKLPDSPDYWETITAPEDIERLLLQRNSHHFGQAEGTPFTTNPLQADIGYKADGYAADLILAGQIEYKSIAPATTLLIRHLQARTTNTLTGTISKEQMLGKLKSWHEKTTTSPSGLHLGHYHCMWRRSNIPSNTPAGERLQHQQELLQTATVDLLNYAIKFSYSYERWKKVVNVMLQKDQNNPRIHRLRVIHIYEADYNLLLAVKWRQAMHHAEDLELLNDGLYGSRTGRSAHDPALIEVFQNEIYRMSMKSGINFDLDATSCYDRILVNVASLSSRRMGMDKSLVLVNAQTLESAKYHLKTKLGVSEGFYSHALENPIHGTGQGSGNSPSIWCFVCSALFDALDSRAHGAVFTSHDTSIKVSLRMIGFVDDCTQRVNLFEDEQQPTAETLITIMEQDAQLWNDLLWASGGALEQSKCSFHLIQSDWTADGHPFLRGGTANAVIKLLNARGRITPTYQKSCYTSHKTLGCYINPAHNHAYTWKHIKEKNNQFAQLLECNYFSCLEAWVFYTSTYLPSITYPLPITPLTKQQCSQLDTRMLRALIPRCGYNRNMARAIRYAPYHLGGAGFKQLYIEQGTLLTKQIFKYLNSPETTIGKLLLATLSWTQAFIGTSTLFITDVHHTIPPIGPSLLLDLRTFLQAVNGSIIMKNPPLSQKLRKHDRFIMDIILQQTKWKPRHIIQLNSCRRYLQAQTLADISTLSGTRLLQHIATGTNPPARHKIKTAMFNQQRPGNQAWKTWKRFLTTIANAKGILRQPLGPWTVSASSLRHWPQYLYDPCIDQLYSHLSDDKYLAHARLWQGQFAITPSYPPTRARGYPTAVQCLMDRLQPHKNFTREALTIANGESELSQQIVPLIPEDELTHHLAQCNLVMCSDGSVTNEVGSYGFTIATQQGIRLIKGRGHAPGSFANSFRSEAYGVLCTLKWLQQAIQSSAVNIDDPRQIIHYLDNKSVIRRVRMACLQRKLIPNQRLLAEHDVIHEIATIWWQLPVHVHFEWVQGHQDSGRPIRTLSLPAQLNCEADAEAGNFKLPPAKTQDHIPFLSTTHCHLIVGSKTITSHIKNKIYEMTTRPQWFEYLQQKYQWSDTVLETIDWCSYSYIIKKYKPQWPTLVKHVHDISPTSHISHRNNPNLPHECPACGQAEEDNIHVLQCHHPSCHNWRMLNLQKIKRYDNPQSDPYLIDILQDGIRRFHQNLPPPSQQQYPERYRTLITSQNSIGWDQLYKGRWSTNWKQAQDTFYHQRHRTQLVLSGQQWVLEMGRLMIDSWFELWKIRNEQRHGYEKTQQQQIKAVQLKTELQDIYTYRDKVCPDDTKLFHQNVEEHFSSHSLSSIETWIALHREAIKASAQQAARLGIQHNRTILDYPTFNPIDQARQQATFGGSLPG